MWFGKDGKILGYLLTSKLLVKTGIYHKQFRHRVQNTKYPLI
jgi:hypothetical protein